VTNEPPFARFLHENYPLPSDFLRIIHPFSPYSFRPLFAKSSEKQGFSSF
jgi:hypothetical protein